MKLVALLAEDDRGHRWLTVPGRGRARSVYTVDEAARRLRRSRRQLYRLIHRGDLTPAGKILRNWLLDREQVEALSAAPMAVQRLPRRLEPLFPDYPLRSLNAGRDRALVMARVLESGTIRDVRWLQSRYGKTAIRLFLRERGSRTLSRRSLRLWTGTFRVSPLRSGFNRSAAPWPAFSA